MLERSVMANPFFSKLLLVVFCLVFSIAQISHAKSDNAELSVNGMPKELYEGMINFEINSGNFFRALVLMNDNYIASNPVSYIRALWGFHIEGDVNQLLSKFSDNKAKSNLSVQDRFYIGEILYEKGECLESLKAFKTLKKKLSLDDKQRYAFYAANCFIKLGSDKRAAKVLTDILAGKWAAYAYYNLAMSYAEASRDKTKALVALRVAASLNGNKTSDEKALNDRIYLAAASLYLESEKTQNSLEFFKKIHLDSESSAQALYLNGLAHLELGDFRSANQSWLAAKKYPLLNAATAESILAIPYAFERSGYVSQALEAYLEASSNFENELKLIDKVDKALEKYGVQKVLIDNTEIEGLEWFLANDIALNTTRASYFNYFVSDDAIYDGIELHAELELLEQSGNFWQGQLNVFNNSLSKKKKNFGVNKKSFNSKTIEKKISKYGQSLQQISSNALLNTEHKKSAQFAAMQNGLNTLRERLEELKSKVKVGEKALDKQLLEIKKLENKTTKLSKKITKIKARNDVIITAAIRERLSGLRVHMLSNYERAEQGLIHIFQGIAESKQRKKGKKNSKGGKVR